MVVTIVRCDAFYSRSMPLIPTRRVQAGQQNLLKNYHTMRSSSKSTELSAVAGTSAASGGQVITTDLNVREHSKLVLGADSAVKISKLVLGPLDWFSRHQMAVVLTVIVGAVCSTLAGFVFLSERMYDSATSYVAQLDKSVPRQEGVSVSQ
jgi:ethanolamine utilization microcompartment shell protein EutS